MKRFKKKLDVKKLFVPVLFTVLFLSLIPGCKGFNYSEKNGAETLLVEDPALVTGTLENGFRYVLMENHEPEHRVSMHLVIQSGSMHETDEQQGLAHFLEHMLFNGTKNFPPGELIKYFQSIGMQFGADANAHTGFYETVYDIILPEGERKDLEDSLVVMFDYANNALLLETEVSREKKVILAEKRDRDSASYRMFESTLQFEVPDMRMAERLPIGTESTIKNANRDILKAYYDTWYRPDNMILVVVGDFDTGLAAGLVENKFSPLKARAEKGQIASPGDINHKGLKIFHHYEGDIGKTTVSIETLTKTSRIKDSLSFRTDQLVKYFANRIVQNRLNSLTKKPETPFTNASVSSGIFLRHVKYADISAECSPEKWEETLFLVEQNLRQALEYGFTEAELKRVIQNYISRLEQGVKTASTRNSNSLAREIIGSINDEKVFLSPEQKMELFAPLVASLTLEDVNTAFRGAWDSDHRLVLVTGNAELADQETTPEVSIRNAYNKSLALAIQKPAEEKKVVFPYLPEPMGAGKIKKKELATDLGITVVEFENGVRLNLKKTDFKANQILFKLVFGGGESKQPADKPGLASLSASLINESGFGELDNEEIKRALAGKNTGMYFSVDEESFTLAGSSIPEETELMFQLIRTQLLDPGFREDAYVLTMERMNQKYQKLSKTIAGADILYGARFLAGGDNRFGLPEFNEFKNNSVADVESWAGKAIQEGALELSIVGDINLDVLIEQTSKYLGTLDSGRKQLVPISKSSGAFPVFPKGKSMDLKVDTEIPRGLVKVAYPTEDFWDISRTRRLSALGAVFSEKLRNKVREELGAAYSPYAYNHSSTAYPGYGVFQAVVSVSPEQAGMVGDKIKTISAELAQEGISEDELKRAIDPILTSIRDMRRTNSYWINSVLSGSGRHPDKFKWAISMEDDYRSITVDDILSFSRKYLDNSNATTIIIRPEQ